MKKWLPVLVLLVLLTGVYSCERNRSVDSCNSTLFVGDNTTRLQDEKTLTTLYKELETFSGATSCNGKESWLFAPVGAKPCGGPAAYLPYKNDIDIDCFLKKVNHYTAQSQKFNVKYSIASDCAVTPAPKAVSCKEGLPVLIY